jgi:mannose-6-phosphate isomerase-like protein (cupin superfamily)
LSEGGKALRSTTSTLTLSSANSEQDAIPRCPFSTKWDKYRDFTEDMMEKVNLTQKLGLFDEYWSPKIVGKLNGQVIKIAKLKGEFLWHHHEVEDELFMVVRGRMVIKLRDQDVPLEQGEFFVVPRGVEHKPVAEEEAHVLMFEPESTLNTGNVQSERTVEEPEWI